MTKNLLALLVISAAIPAGMAQVQHPLPRPLARTPDEYDLYVQFLETLNPAARHDMAIRFESAYPESQLLVNVYESEIEYARSQEQLQAAITAGQNALRFEPDDVKVLVGMAEVLASATSDLPTLLRAEEYAGKALVELDEMRFSRTVPLRDCEDVRNTLVSRTHAALANILGKRGKLAAAIKEIELAVALSPQPSGSEMLLAGKLYRLGKRNQEAMEMFRRAAVAGPTAITLFANREISDLSQSK